MRALLLYVLLRPIREIVQNISLPCAGVALCCPQHVVLNVITNAGSPWQKSSRVGQRRRKRLRHHRESIVCGAGGAGVHTAAALPTRHPGAAAATTLPALHD